MEAAIVVGAWSLVSVIALVLVTALVMGFLARQRRRAEAVADARADARRWYDLLGGQLSIVTARGDEVAAVSLAEAATRHERAARELEAATTVDAYRVVRGTATEGLRHIGAARARLGLAAGPQGPAESRTVHAEVYNASPAATSARDGDDRYEQPRGDVAASEAVASS